MLPKLISSSSVDSATTDLEPEGGGNGDVSMESSQSCMSSIIIFDCRLTVILATAQGADLTPLERARRRRSMILGPTA